MVKAVSSQQEARNSQNYVEDPPLRVCGTCEHYQSVRIETAWGGREEKRRRCSLGKFAVKRKATCRMHRFKGNQSKDGQNEGGENAE